MESHISEWQLNRYWYAGFCQKSILKHENAFILEYLSHISILGMNSDNTDSQKLNKIISEIQALQEVVARFRQLRLDATEFACLKCIVTFKAGKQTDGPLSLPRLLLHPTSSATSRPVLDWPGWGAVGAAVFSWGWYSEVGPVFHSCGDLNAFRVIIHLQCPVSSWSSLFSRLSSTSSALWTHGPPYSVSHGFLAFVSSSYTQRFWTEKFPECCCHCSSSRWSSANSQQLHPHQVTAICCEHVLKKIASIVNVPAGSKKPVQTLWLIILLPAS